MQFCNNLAHDSLTVAVCSFEDDGGRDTGQRNAGPTASQTTRIGQSDAFPVESITSDGPLSLKQLSADLMRRRAGDLASTEESVRLAARDMLRHGKFKPTGRSKPASEYLLGLARSLQPLPEVLPAVDAANYVSLKYLLPVSVWDLDRGDTRSYEFRFGRPGESYVFNHAGHTIDVEDLVCGCRYVDSTTEGAESVPIVNPVKDSMATKLNVDSTRIALAVYTPPHLSTAEIDPMLDEIADVFERYVGLRLTTRSILRPGDATNDNAGGDDATTNRVDDSDNIVSHPPANS